jgi:hypothetical protein
VDRISLVRSAVLLGICLFDTCGGTRGYVGITPCRTSWLTSADRFTGIGCWWPETSCCTWRRGWHSLTVHGATTGEGKSRDCVGIILMYVRLWGRVSRLVWILRSWSLGSCVWSACGNLLCRIWCLLPYVRFRRRCFESVLGSFWKTGGYYVDSYIDVHSPRIPRSIRGQANIHVSI